MSSSYHSPYARPEVDRRAGWYGPPGLADPAGGPRIECRGPGLTDAFDRWQQRLQQILSALVAIPAAAALLLLAREVLFPRLDHT